VDFRSTFCETVICSKINVCSGRIDAQSWNLTVLVLTRFVDIPHDDFAIARASQNLVVEIWIMMSTLRARELGKEGRTSMTPGYVCAGAIHFEPAAIPEIARRIYSMAASTNS
jgi:hypothetical protein